MADIKFIYFEGCPEAKNLRAALLLAGINDFKVIIQDTLPKGDPYLKFSSPSILLEDELIYGIRTDGELASCTFDTINFVDEKSLIERFRQLKNDPVKVNVKRNYSSFLGAGLSTLLVLKCPACIPGAVAFLSAVGLGFIITPVVMKSVLVSLLFFTLAGLLFSYLKYHKNIYPFLLGLGFSVTLYLGRFHYYGVEINQYITYGAIVGLVGISLWDIRLKLVKKCPACIN